LKKLLKGEGQVAPELHLLHCLELAKHEDKNSAKSLKRYADLARESKTKAHPLFLIAFARHSEEEEERRSAILKFAELYPDAVDKVGP
jgi:hypothetical protein